MQFPMQVSVRKQARISWKELPAHTSSALRTWQDRIQCGTKTKTDKILSSSRTPNQFSFLCLTLYIHICTLYLSALVGFSVLLNHHKPGSYAQAKKIFFSIFSHYCMHSIIDSPLHNKIGFCSCIDACTVESLSKDTIAITSLLSLQRTLP